MPPSIRTHHEAAACSDRAASASSPSRRAEGVRDDDKWTAWLWNYSCWKWAIDAVGTMACLIERDNWKSMNDISIANWFRSSINSFKWRQCCLEEGTHFFLLFFFFKSCIWLSAAQTIEPPTPQLSVSKSSNRRTRSSSYHVNLNEFHFWLGCFRGLRFTSVLPVFFPLFSILPAFFPSTIIIWPFCDDRMKAVGV